MKNQNADVILKYLDDQINKLVERTEKEKQDIEQLNEEIVKLLQGSIKGDERRSLL